MDAAELVRSSLDGPMPALLPWQEAMYRGDWRRLTVGAGRPMGQRLEAATAVAVALATGETVQICSTSKADAGALMVEARKVVAEWGEL
jgi:hypothetical protein